MLTNTSTKTNCFPPWPWKLYLYEKILLGVKDRFKGHTNRVSFKGEMRLEFIQLPFAWFAIFESTVQLLGLPTYSITDLPFQRSMNGLLQKSYFNGSQSLSFSLTYNV